VLGLALATGCGAASAFSVPASEDEMPASTYFSAGVLHSNIDAGPTFPIGTYRFPALGYKLGAGGVIVNHVSAEVEFIDLGRRSWDSYGPSPYSIDLRVRSVAAFARYTLPVWKFGLFAKAGIAHTSTSAQYSNVTQPLLCALGPQACASTGPSYEFRVTSNKPAAGLGIEYSFGPYAVRLESEAISTPGAHSVITSLAGVAWKF
jgi:hypothetical protein